MSKIPEKINRFNLYHGKLEDGNKILGVTDEVTLPEFEVMSETLNLAGSAGEIDSPSPGQFKSAQIEIPFSNISSEGLAIAADDSEPIILRAAQEELDTETLAKNFIGREITIYGMTKKINYGKLKKGGYGNPSIVKEIVSYKDKLTKTDNSEVILTEINKLNGGYTLNGKNMMADVEKFL